MQFNTDEGYEEHLEAEGAAMAAIAEAKAAEADIEAIEAREFRIKDDLVQKTRRTLQHCVEYIDDCCLEKACDCGGEHSQWVRDALHDFDTGLCLLKKGGQMSSKIEIQATRREKR